MEEDNWEQELKEFKENLAMEVGAHVGSALKVIVEELNHGDVSVEFYQQTIMEYADYLCALEPDAGLESYKMFKERADAARK